jgi:hypothetical protein
MFALDQSTKAERLSIDTTLSLASALDRVGDKRHASAAIPTGKTQYPLYRGWVGPRASLDVPFEVRTKS